MSFAPCPSCRRHVRVRETRCPFCASALPELVARRVELPRLSRAAVMAAVVAAAGCRDKQPEAAADPPTTKADASIAADAKQGATDPATLEAADSATDSTDADADDAVHLHHPPMTKYGAPPLPHTASHPKYGAPPPPLGDPF